MKILDRYISKQILVTSFYGITVLSFVLVLGNVFKQLLELLINHDIPLHYIVTFISFVIPFSLTFTIPWGLLTAILLVYGRLSAENELTAIRCCGVSISRASVPVFVIAGLGTVLCLWINLFVAPRAQKEMKDALVQIATSNPIALFGSDKPIDQFPNKMIYVGDKNGEKLRDITVYNLNNKDVPTEIMRAEHGLIRSDLDNQQIILETEGATYEQRDQNDPEDLSKVRPGMRAGRAPISISLKELYEKNQKRRGLSELTITQLAALNDPKRASSARTEQSKRFSLSFSCLGFALLAVPLGIVRQRHDTSSGFLISLIMGCGYYFFAYFGDWAREKPQYYPEYLVWLPNLLCVIVGIILYRRLARR